MGKRSLLGLFGLLSVLLQMGLNLSTRAGDDVAEARFTRFRYQGEQALSQPRAPGPGEHRNPVIAGFHPDPSFMRVGGTYYLVTSSFGYFPGLPIFRSADLVHWTQIGAAISRPSQLNLDGQWPSNGVYGPDLKHHAGRFYLLSTCYNCGGNFYPDRARSGRALV